MGSRQLLFWTTSDGQLVTVVMAQEAHCACSEADQGNEHLKPSEARV